MPMDIIGCNFIVHCYVLTRGKKGPVSLKNVLGETIMIINAIELWPLCISLLNILCEDIGNMHETFLLHIDIIVISSKNTYMIV